MTFYEMMKIVSNSCPYLNKSKNQLSSSYLQTQPPGPSLQRALPKAALLAAAQRPGRLSDSKPTFCPLSPHTLGRLRALKQACRRKDSIKAANTHYLKVPRIQNLGEKYRGSSKELNTN